MHSPSEQLMPRPARRTPRDFLASGTRCVPALPLALLPLLLPLVLPCLLGAQRPPAASSDTAAVCASCEEWNAPQRPFKLHGNAHYVGTRGLSAILLTSPDGHILLDGGLPQSASRIMDNVRTLGVRVEDIRLIVNSHAHFDHAGGLAALQRASGATVAASAWSASVLSRRRVAARRPAAARGTAVSEGAGGGAWDR